MNDIKKKKLHLSQDEMIKDLILDYPEDALEYLHPEIFKRYGRPVKTSVTLQENKKYSHYDPKRINDIAILYEFKGGEKVVLPLVEHWSDKNQFDIHRLAHYMIDLDKRYPDYEKCPIVLFTDQSDTWYTQPQSEIVIQCLDTVYLKFEYIMVRLKADEAEQYRRTKNKFVAVLRSVMAREADEKIILAIDFIKHYLYLESDVKLLRKHIDIICFYFDLEEEETGEILQLLSKGDGEKMGSFIAAMDEFLEERIEKRIEKRVVEQVEKRLEKQVEKRVEKRAMEKYKLGKLEDAAKMIEKGFSIEDVFDITGLSREDLERGGLLA
ncbi:MAG: hypothetical protein GY754_23500 [bacterium]|nr:hypothetical protein [bacterium]